MNEIDAEYSKKLLIVDDEPYVLRVLKLKLENAGFEIITAVNGVDGLEKFDQERPVVIITDIRMPLMDGQEMYQQIKEHSGADPFFVIMMTSTIDNSLRIWADKMGNIHFIEKPVSPRKVLKLIEQCYLSLRDLNAKL